MKDKNRQANQVLADMEFFDYLKEKVGDRKTKTGAYHDLLEKCAAGFVAPFLKNHEYVLQADQCHVTITDLVSPTLQWNGTGTGLRSGHSSTNWRIWGIYTGHGSPRVWSLQ